MKATRQELIQELTNSRDLLSRMIRDQERGLVWHLGLMSVQIKNVDHILKKEEPLRKRKR